MTLASPPEPVSPVHLVVTREIFVDSDIAATLAEVCPGAEILRASSVAEAFTLIDGTPTISLAFLESVGDPVTLSHLSKAIEQRGGRIVLIGHWSSVESSLRPLATLPVPLGYDDLASFLRQTPI